MSLIVMMLNGSTITSPAPSQPGFYVSMENSGPVSGTEDSVSGIAQTDGLGQIETATPETFYRGYYISTVGLGQNLNLVYGLKNCPGFTPKEVCHNCANSVATKIIQRCPHQKVAFVFNESSLLQYSDLPFFSTADVAIKLVFLSLQNAEDPVLFRSQLGSLLGNISSNAAADTSRLADGRTSYTSSIDIYAMLSSKSVASWVYALSCSIGYKIYSFFSLSMLSPPPPPPSVQFNSIQLQLFVGCCAFAMPLDVSMQPEISDFGLARLFSGSQTQGNTKRIAGLSNGYMALQYAKKGHFSTKSDVYSFGILVLEIVTGQKMSSFRNSINLQSCAWRHWTNGTALELVDPTLGGQRPENENLKCIHIGLLCVQEAVADRPTMSQIVMMLNGNTMTSPTPSRPGFYMPRENSESASGTDDSGSTQLPVSSQQSINWVSITELYRR
ncbi:PREDICTED: cysteine-rich receptor-like protein kinase 10 [Populus euphratica]|uniref:Cysteine-rich receptor-like protein kinase 10 n=1 Tax=Populus euphratica TaxID=75702 RepID=A0AAJ6T2W2_POPEU|nr:PREDICTED: cysteine-rich receptor-like protein kinase 10 [Populus euphratica]